MPVIYDGTVKTEYLRYERFPRKAKASEPVRSSADRWRGRQRGTVHEQTFMLPGSGRVLALAVRAVDGGTTAVRGPGRQSHPHSPRRPGVFHFLGYFKMRFHSDPNLKPVEIQPPTIERRTPTVLARKPATRERTRRALRKSGTIALYGAVAALILLSGAYVAYLASWWRAAR
jgi:hypothetical protein